MASVNKTEADGSNNDQEQWDDAALVTAPKKTVVASAEVMDMKSLEKEHENIAEKLRVEETRAQLAAAREGMERRAAEHKEEKQPTQPTRFAAAATGGKWMPPHIRSGGGMKSTKLDVQDEELFPDLASAEKILEQKQQQQHTAYKPIKKTPVGGGATWASKVNVAKVKKDITPPVEESEVVEEQQAEEPKQPPAQTTTKVLSSSATAATRTKKKKKDLSTFTPGGSS